MRDASRGLWLGFVGTAAFSLTLPAAEVAVAALHPMIVGVGRAVVAAVPAHERPGRLFWACSLFGSAVLALVVLAVAIGRKCTGAHLARGGRAQALGAAGTRLYFAGGARSDPRRTVAPAGSFPDGASRGK